MNNPQTHTPKASAPETRMGPLRKAQLTEHARIEHGAQQHSTKFNVPELRREIYRLTDELAKASRKVNHADKLADASRKFLAKIDSVTSLEFAHGFDKTEREEMRTTLAEYQNAKGG